jgi:hypothetical protein
LSARARTRTGAPAGRIAGLDARARTRAPADRIAG